MGPPTGTSSQGGTGAFVPHLPPVRTGYRCGTPTCVTGACWWQVCREATGHKHERSSTNGSLFSCLGQEWGQPLLELFLAPGRAGVQWVGRKNLQRWLHPCVSLNSSTLLLRQSGFPPSHPLWLSPHRQQQSSSWVYSSIPMSQLSASMHTGRHTSQSGTGRAEAQAICASLTLSCRPQTSGFTLLWQPQMLPFCPNQSSAGEQASQLRNLSSASTSLMVRASWKEGLLFTMVISYWSTLLIKTPV